MRAKTKQNCCSCSLVCAQSVSASKTWPLEGFHPDCMETMTEQGVVDLARFMRAQIPIWGSEPIYRLEATLPARFKLPNLRGVMMSNLFWMMEGLASEGGDQKTIMIDATDLKAHRTASSLRARKGGLTTSAGV